MDFSPSERTQALTERLGNHDHALAIISALEGAFILSRAHRTTAPLHAAGEMAATLLSRPA